MTSNIDGKPYAQASMDFISKICQHYYVRPPGSPNEKCAAQLIQDEFAPLSDETFIDEFPIHPGLYPNGTIILFAIMAFIGLPFILFDGFWNLLTILLPLLGGLQVVWSLMGMRETFAFLFKKAQSQNVLGKIKPRDESGMIKSPKMKIVIAGHVDSANEMRIARLGDHIAKVTLMVFVYLLCVILLALIKYIVLHVNSNSIIIKVAGPITFTYLDIVFIILSIPGIPLLIFVLIGYIIGTPVPGANDNLGGIGIAYALAKYFTQPDQRLRNVELWVGGFGSEECGERGSHAFVLKYGQLGELDNAYGMIPESCVAGTNLAVVTAEPFHFVHHHPEVYNRLFKGYLQYKDDHKEDNPEDIVPCELRILPVAASDAGRFSLAGYKASMLLGFEGKLMKPANWHAPSDSPENMSFKMTLASFEIFQNTLVQLDKDLN